MHFSVSSVAQGLNRCAQANRIHSPGPFVQTPRLHAALLAQEPQSSCEDVLVLEQGTRSGFTVLVDYGKCENFTQGAEGELKLFEALQRIDPERFPTPSSAKKTIRKGTVLVDGRPGRIDTTISFGQQHLKILHRTSTSFKPVGEAPFHVDILYEDHCVRAHHAAAWPRI